MTMPRTRELPRYGIREDEMTRPGIVLYDWNGDDEKTVRLARPFPYAKHVRPRAAQVEPELDKDSFRPRWHGIGRSAGAVILGIVVGMWVAIDLFAVLAPETLGNLPGRPPVDGTQR
jgi:hypothetical protein